MNVFRITAIAAFTFVFLAACSPSPAANTEPSLLETPEIPQTVFVATEVPANAETEVAMRLGATATAQAYMHSTMTIEAAFQAALTGTVQVEASQDAQATATEASIQTAVQRSVFATMTEEQRPLMETRQAIDATATAEINATINAVETATAAKQIAETATQQPIDMTSTFVQRATWDVQNARGTTNAVSRNSTRVARSVTLTAVKVISSSTEQAINAIATAQFEDVLRGDVIITSNDQWLPKANDIDGVMMALIPPGCFNMGGETDSDGPIHRLCFDKPFWIDEVEVSMRQFSARNGRKAINQFIYENLPVTQITWSEALEYCSNRGARLPTEAEWEFAARGPNNDLYPWGKSSISEGDSWAGITKIDTEVWEWTHSLHQPYPYNATDGRESDLNSQSDVRRVARGGWSSFRNSLSPVFTRAWRPADSAEDDLGFRCVRDFETVDFNFN